VAGARWRLKTCRIRSVSPWRFTGIFERLGVPYVTAGSLASSLHGLPRSTDDIDLVADLLPAHAAALVTVLGGDWYVAAIHQRQ
jgi:hypothetical protein